METDDLDNLIAESLAGVGTALEGERKANAETAASNAGEAVRELQQGPSSAADGVPSEVFFGNLVKSFQDENFQKSMAQALQISDDKEPPSSALASSPTAPASGSSADAGVEDFLQNFMKSFESAVGNDESFANSLSSLMTSMLNKDVIVEPLQQIADALEPWLRDQKGLAQADRSRYEAQLKLYKDIIHIYASVDSDNIPDSAKQEVNRLLAELHTLGEPPAEVMKQIAPKEAGNNDETFEDFVNSMGLGENLGAAEKDLLQKLTEDPEELTKVMKDMASKLGSGDSDSPEEACKQQ